MQLILIRHGESFANALHRETGGFFCGRWDCGLTDVGKLQAAALKGSVFLRGADAVYASPLKRAVATAAALTDLPVILDERLTERSLGDFDGKSRDEVARNDVYRKYFTDARYTGFRHSFTVSAPNGESYADVEKRVSPFLAELKKKPYKKVVVVSHAVAIRCMAKLVLGLTEEETLRFPTKQCAPAVLEF